MILQIYNSYCYTYYCGADGQTLVAPPSLKKGTNAQAWRNRRKIGIMFHETTYAVMKCAPKKFRKLPRAARFCAKRFRGIDFWTYLLCPFLKNFSSLVQSFFKK